MTKIGFYIHVPFCEKKCGYCDFYSVAGCLEPTQKKEDFETGMSAFEEMKTYFEALVREIVAAPRCIVDTIYIGGGTPSLLSQKQIDTLLNVINKHHCITSDAEITIEVNPKTMTNATGDDGYDFAAWKAAGVNRVSIGVQAMDDTLLAALGRGHTAKDARLTVEAAAKWFDNISIDLLYDVPGLSLELWDKTLRTAAGWGIAHISAYGLKLEPTVPLYDTWIVPDDEAQFLLACGLLPQLGFEQYEISNFARAGRESRHNLKYWTLQPYLGFGPSAHSDFNGERLANSCHLTDWHVTARDCIFAKERTQERVMLGLRLREGIALDVLGSDKVPVLEQMAATGLVLSDDNRVRLTPSGMLVSNAVIAALL